VNAVTRPSGSVITSNSLNYDLVDIQAPSDRAVSSTMPNKNRQNFADTFRRADTKSVKEIKSWNSKKRHGVYGVYHLAVLTWLTD